MHILHDPRYLYCMVQHHRFLEDFLMPVPHEKCPLRVAQTGLLLLVMQYKFF